MKVSTTVIWLAVLIMILALVAAGVGVVGGSDAAPETSTTARGTSATLYGGGIYRYDSLMIGAGCRG